MERKQSLRLRPITKTIKTAKTIAKSLPSLVRNHHNGLKGLVGLNALITSSRLASLVAARITRRGSHHSSRLAATT